MRGELDRRQLLKGLGGAAAALALPRSGSGAAPPPNFVLIVADDLGYGDLGCYGSPRLRTPRLDRMAAEGVRLTDYYSPSHVCTAARAGLLTGCYGPRVGLPSVLRPRQRIGLAPGEVTLAELLKGRGYATACVGKWHLGSRAPFLPVFHGFDRFFGLPHSNGMRPLPLMRGTEVVEEPARQETLTERYTEEAVAFLRQVRDRPFFLYLPHTFPHVPLHASERFRGSSGAGLYGDVVFALDWSTGVILDALEELGLAEGTLVAFTSDNGPDLGEGEHGGSAGPLRGGKHSTYEGGMRVPCLARWPGRIPAGTVSSEVVAGLDFLPTFVRLAGTRPPADRILDGRDAWPLLAGEPGAKSPHGAFFYFRGDRVEAVRAGRWKLHRERTIRRRGRVVRSFPRRLYDLEADLGETRNVGPRHPAVAARLEGLAREGEAELRRHRRPPGRV